MFFRRLFRSYLAAFADLPRSAWLLSLVVFINRSGSMVLFFLTLYLTRKLGFSVSGAGQMISIYGLGALIGTYFGGWLSDTIGPRKVQMASLVLNGIGFISLSYLLSPVPIAILMFFIAVAGEAFRPANAAAMAEVCPPVLRARGFALNRLAINLGITVGPAAGGFLATVNYNYLFWADGITCFVAAVLLWYFLDSRGVEPSDSEKSTEGYRSPWQDRLYMVILVLVFLSALIFVQLFNTWPIYLREEYQLLESRIGLLMTLNALMVVLIEMPLIHRLEKRSHIKIIAFGTLFLGTGFALLPLGRGFFFGAFTVMIWTVGEILVFPLIAGFIANRAVSRIRGKYMGMFNFSFSLAVFVGPALGTAIYDYLGSHVLWMLCGVAGIALFAGFRLVERFITGKS